MAKDAAPPEGEAPNTPNKKGKLLVIIIIAAVVVLVLAGGGAYFLMSKPAAEKKAKAGHGAEEVAADVEESGSEAEHPPLYEKLETFTVNLADQESYLQTEVQLMLADAKVQEKLKAHLPEVRDALIRLLSSKTAEELSQPEGKVKLAEEVQKAVNEVLGVKKKAKGVKKVLFAAFIIQ